MRLNTNFPKQTENKYYSLQVDSILESFPEKWHKQKSNIN